MSYMLQVSAHSAPGARCQECSLVEIKDRKRAGFLTLESHKKVLPKQHNLVSTSEILQWLLLRKQALSGRLVRLWGSVQ